MRKSVGLLLAVAVLVGVASVAQADGGSPPTRSDHILGMVLSAHSNAGGSTGAGALKYHGGPVEHTNTSYAIYWVPSGYTVASDYQTLINRFFTDVAADSGKTTNVYYSDTQYTDGSGHVAYSSTFGGSAVDTSAFPASGCTDTVSQTSVCLTDAQLQAEVQRMIAAHAWTAGPTHEFFVFTPKGVGSCAGSSCAFSQYCAYHSWAGSGSSVVLYANQPYTDTVPAACDNGVHPNGSEADPTINVVSHEHNETITDELGNAWYDAAGYENGDKCAWKFGSSIGSTSFGSFNQSINGHPYELQQEYSNASKGCVLRGT